MQLAKRFLRGYQTAGSIVSSRWFSMLCRETFLRLGQEHRPLTVLLGARDRTRLYVLPLHHTSHTRMALHICTHLSRCEGNSVRPTILTCPSTVCHAFFNISAIKSHWGVQCMTAHPLGPSNHLHSHPSQIARHGSPLQRNVREFKQAGTPSRNIQSTNTSNSLVTCVAIHVRGSCPTPCQTEQLSTTLQAI